MKPDEARRELARAQEELAELKRRESSRVLPDRVADISRRIIERLNPKKEDTAMPTSIFDEPTTQRRTLTAGGSGTFAGADGITRTVKVDQHLTQPGSHPQMPDIARPTQPGVVRSLTRPAPVAPAPPRTLSSPTTPMPGSTSTTTVTPNPSANGGPQFWQDQANSLPTITRPGATMAQLDAPRTMSTRHDPNGYAVSQAQRSLDMAQNQAQFNAKKVGLTRTQRQAMSGADQAGIAFWRDQAQSLGPGAANRMAELQAQQQGENFRTLTRNAVGVQTSAANNEAAFQRTLMGEQGQAQRSAADNAARLAAEQIQRDGAMDRQAEQNRFALTRPQTPIARADGSLGFASPSGGFQALTDADGNPVRGLTPQPAQPTGLNALAKLTSDLTPQFLGADNYGMVPDESVPKGRRPATAEDRQAAIRAATAAARETLGIQNPAASSQPASQPSPQASTAQPGTPRGSLDDFINAAMKSNPDYSREELADFFAQRYGNR